MGDVSAVIVLEQSARFCRELEIEWSRHAVTGARDFAIGGVESAVSAAEVISWANSNRSGVVVADLTVGQPEVFRLLERWDWNWPIVVVGPPETAELEWPLRELGATAVLFEPVNPSRLLAMCRRVLWDVA